MTEKFHQQMIESGEFDKRRETQNKQWMNDLIKDFLLAKLYEDNLIKTTINILEKEVGSGKISAILAANKIIDLL